MGLFKRDKPSWREVLHDGIKEVTDIADEAVVDKDKVVQLKGKLKEIELAALNGARELASKELEELKGPVINFIRAVQRPMWSTVACIAFAFEVFTYLAPTVWVLFGRDLSLSFPDPPQFINMIILAIVMFYFGSRFMEKQTKNKFFEKWGI